MMEYVGFTISDSDNIYIYEKIDSFKCVEHDIRSLFNCPICKILTCKQAKDSDIQKKIIV